jgi:hypothetical protein
MSRAERGHLGESIVDALGHRGALPYRSWSESSRTEPWYPVQDVNHVESRVLPGENSLSKYISEEEGAWFGACHLYDHLRPFMFGEDVEDVPRFFSSALEILNRLSIPNRESRRALVKFLESVRARVVRDIAITLREEFVQHWMIWDEGLYGGWDHLENMCRLREDLDLHYPGIELRKFFPPPPLCGPLCPAVLLLRCARGLDKLCVYGYYQRRQTPWTKRHGKRP